MELKELKELKKLKDNSTKMLHFLGGAFDHKTIVL